MKIKLKSIFNSIFKNEVSNEDIKNEIKNYVYKEIESIDSLDLSYIGLQFKIDFEDHSESVIITPSNLYTAILFESGESVLDAIGKNEILYYNKYYIFEWNSGKPILKIDKIKPIEINFSITNKE